MITDFFYLYKRLIISEQNLNCMTDPSGLAIRSIERTCIACPASWFGETTDGGSWYVRFRGGVFSLRYSNMSPDELDKNYVSGKNEIYRDEGYDRYDGHMDVYQLKDKLTHLGVGFEEEVVPSEFYDGLVPSECRFLLVGEWFSEATCSNCDYSLDSETVETIQYETVIPDECPDCASDVCVRTERPERVENWSEQA